MGYAVFTARKIMLNTQINNLQFRLMALSQQKQNLSQYSSNMQQQFGNMSMMLGSGMNGFGGGIFGNMLGGLGMGLMGGMSGMAGMYGGGVGNIFAQSAYNQATYMQQMQLSAMGQAMLKPVAMAETQIDNQMKSIETQLKAKQAELDKVEEAEGKAIEKSAPKFA